jgi:hypothetical protein
VLLGRAVAGPIGGEISAAEIRKVHCAGVSKSEIARCLNIDRTSVPAASA